jgi:hypothetical protein
MAGDLDLTADRHMTPNSLPALRAAAALDRLASPDACCPIRPEPGRGRDRLAEALLDPEAS